ncbi:MAG: YkgJ family cysteine cluster protein [Halobacteriota archaeon]
MDVNCQGCAGCCIDWRPLVPDPIDHEHAGGRPPIDGTYNLVPLTGEEVRAFVDAGYGDAMTPRLFEAGPADDSVSVDGYDLAAIGDRPVFYLGLRKPPKPVGPFDLDRRWLRSCAFLDPETLRCRIHGDDLYPDTCGHYPEHNLLLDAETECERVERSVDSRKRLVDPTLPADVERPPFGPGAVGYKLFAHPDPEQLPGVVSRLAVNELTDADRAAFVAIACGSSPGTVEINDAVRDRCRRAALDASSWIGRSIEEWTDRADSVGSQATVEAPGTVETDYGAPDAGEW